MKLKLDELCINTIRFLAVDAIQKAKSGHPGLPLGAAPMAYMLWTRYLRRHNPGNPQWFDRDRFILSAGHGSMLLYSLLHLTGYDVPLEQMKRFRQWGVREHGMGAIMNGMAAHGGTLPFGATFLTFSDYMRPAIRLAAVMRLHVVYVFTHDSICMGEDGPTHQPVEHLASLRAIPGLIVIRPGDANETAEAWRVAIETKDHPVALVLTRQSVPTLDRNQFAPAKGLRRGAYILADAPGEKPQLILIASGSEVGLAAAARQQLLERKIPVRLVSMPSWELFEAQPREYRDSVLPPSIKTRLAVEAGVTPAWRRYVGDHGDVIGVDRFGASAPGPVVMREYGFTVENVCRRAVALLQGSNLD